MEKINKSNVTKILLGFWKDVLKKDVSVDDNFYSVGGSSLVMLQLVSKISDTFAVEIEPDKFIELSSIRNIADFIAAMDAEKQFDAKNENEYENSFKPSVVQEAYYIGRNDGYELGGMSTHAYYEIATDFDIKKLTEALNILISKQPALRTVMREDGDYMILDDVPNYIIECDDCNGESLDDIEAKIKEVRSTLSQCVLDVNKWPLFKIIALTGIKDVKTYLFIHLDLLIMDGASIVIFMSEWNKICQDIDIPNVTFDIVAHQVKQNEMRSSGKYLEDKEYWLKQIDSFPPAAHLKLKQDIRCVEKISAKRVQKVIDRDLYEKISKVAAANQVSPSVVFGTAYAYVLGFWSNQKELAINLTTMDRPMVPGTERTMGEFTKVVLLDTSLDAKKTFWENCKTIQKRLLSGLGHRAYDGIEFIREIMRKMDTQSSVVMPIVFTSMLFSSGDMTVDALGDMKFAISQTSQVYLDSQVSEIKEGILFNWDYIEELFDPDVVTAMFNQYIALIESLPDKVLSYPQIEDCDKRKIEKYNSTFEDFPETTIQNVFKQVAESYQDKEIVVDSEGRLLCKELDRKSSQIANFLLEKGVSKGKIVAVKGDRNRKTITNILGILKSGAAYVAIDPEFPEERQQYILNHSESCMCLDTDFYERECLNKYSDKMPNIEYNPQDLAYIIYTSGSTGIPKGVSVTQGAVMNTVLDINKKFNVTAEDKIIGLSSMCFDLSVYDIFGCFSTGATLVEIPDIHDVYNISKVIKDEGITIWNSVPAIMEMMLDNITKTEDPDFWMMDGNSQVNINLEDNPLRLVLLSGDWIPVSLPDRIRKEYEDAKVVSLGGATEASIWSIYYPVEEVNPEWKSIPYGTPLSNQTYYVLNYRMEDCPIGVSGELYIGGKGLAQGYYRDAEKTEEAFVEHPSYGRLYKTGDYGVMTEDGYIVFQGRKDQQVKISGHRIELGEIENRLMQHESVRNCVVVDWEDDNRKKYLCAYVVADGKISCDDLSLYLAETLPDYMIPMYFVEISEIPLNQNGKVIRTALKKPEQVEDTKSKIYARTETEKKLSGIWSEVLGIENIGIKDQFLRLGGDSIKMVNTLSKITDIFHVRISFKEFMLANTIEKMAVLVDGRDDSDIKVVYAQREHSSQNEYDDFALTDVQMAYLIGRNEGIDLGGISTHGYYEILTHLDMQKLEESLNKVIKIQPMLRAVINKNGTQKILEEVPQYKIVIQDIRNYSEQEQKEAIITERNRMSHHIFDTEKWPLFEFKAFYITENTYYLFMGIDLLIADGGSIRIFIGELLDIYYDKFYEAENSDFTYKDYVEALNEFKESDTYKKDKEYWMEQLSLIPPAPALPLGKQPSEIVNPQFVRCEKLIPLTEWDALKKKAKERGITASSLLCTAYAVVLGYWSNQPELTINVTVFTRYPFNKNVNNIVGDFTSVILLRVDLLNRNDFWELASEIQKQLMEALEHRHYDGINVIREIAKEKDMKRQAVMPVVFTSLLFSMGKDDNTTIADLGEIKMGVSQTSQVYLDYQVMETKDGLSITWDYVEELFDAGMMSTMFTQYTNLVESLINDRVVFPKLENQMVEKISDYNDTKSSIPETTIQEVFREVAEKYPTKTIIVDENGNISCSELDKMSSQIANYLLDNGIGRGDVVAVSGVRKKETIINILGVLKAGAAYVAVEPEYPEERQKYILEHSKSRMYLNPEFYEENDLNQYADVLEKVIYSASDLAYIIYTSGSTGTPKGVAITQGAVMNTVLDINEKFNVTAEDKIIGLSSMCFDLSVYDIFGCFSTGATLVEIPDIHDVYNISKVIKDEGITIWNSVPAIMEMMLDNITKTEEPDFWMMDGNSQININLEDKPLRLVLLSGDWIPVSLPDRIRKEYEDAKVVSLGGATEASIWSIYYPVEEVDLEWRSIPYGTPLSNQTYYVLNYRMEDCPIGVSGELYIGGKGLAQGYYRDAEKTEEAFVEHPSYGRLYKTGDYGVMTEDGYIVFQGRKDQQVKISGHRIELGEIENRLMQHESVKNCVVVDWEDDSRKKYLCAYIVTDMQIVKDELQDFLKLSLPEYMIPNYYEIIEEIPLSANGKVDRKKLTKPNYSSEQNRIIVEPRTETEKLLVDLWKEILNVEEVSVKDSFLGIGGDSIQMVRTLGCIAERLKTGVSYKEFLLFNTPEKLAKLIDEGRSEKSVIEYPQYVHNQEDEYEDFPLTDVQMAYLLGRNEEFDLGGVSTHGYYEVLISMEIKQLEKALNQIIKEQSMMRTVFTERGTQRILKDVPEYRIAVEDLSNCDNQTQQQKILEERSRMSHYVFDTKKWPLFEFKAFKLNAIEYYLFIGIDLLIADGSSMRILVKGLKQYHTLEEKGVIKNEFNYKDYVSALEKFKSSDAYLKDQKYWINRVDQLPSAPGLPLKKELGEVKNPHFERCQENIEFAIWERIKEKAREKEITTSALLCSIYAAVLGYWSNQKELTINVTVFTRYPFNENVNNIIGDFTSVILLDVNLEGLDDFWKFAHGVQKQLMEALEHRHFDGINVIKEIAKRRDMQQQAVMPVVFTSLLFAMDSEDNATIDDLGEIKMGVSQTSQVYLDYQVMETKNGLSITWDYISELFDEKMIRTMFVQYLDMLKNLDDDCGRILDITSEDREIIQNYNSTQQDIPNTTIQHEFKKVAKDNPDKIIVSDNMGSLTCKELDQKSTQIAHYLISKGVKTGDVIGVLGVRKKETITNILGVLKAGAAYVAIDPEYPKDRQEYILEHSESSHLLEPDFYEKNDIKNYPITDVDVVYKTSDIAYIIYTSGSTGLPKGVVISQAAVMNTVLDINQKFDISSTDKIIGLSSMCFDLSVYDIFGSLSTGAMLVEIEDIHDVANLRKVVKEKGITVWNSVPAIMEIFISNLDQKNQFPSLKTVLLSGDWIPVDMPDKIKGVSANVQVVSLGGATEGSIWSIYYPIKTVDSNWKSIPYGKPLANQTYYILNFAGRDCPVGVSGELYIGGKGVAEGYYKDKEKTEAAFIDHPQYGRIYRTGDYGVLLENGNIIFQGRKDFQVKISGHRIEMGEIENQLLKHPKIKGCVVVDWNDDFGKKYLCGYFVSDEDIKSDELHNVLHDKLPSYMIPKCFERIGEIPLNINGKVDRKELPRPEFGTKQRDKCISPRTVKENDVLAIWKDVLKIPNISIYDDFFEIGGDSIAAMKVFTALTQKYQISIKELYAYRDIASLSRMLRKKDSTLYFNFLKNQFYEMEEVLRNPDDEYRESYQSYVEGIEKKYSRVELGTCENYRNILFIGATGFLGSHILYEYLTHTDADIYAVIRGKDEESARERLKNTLDFFDKYNSQWESRIHVMVGDISLKNFGISDENYLTLLSKVDCVFNCAAIVSHLGLYETMYKSNVLGCKSILRFVEEKKDVKVFHISTKHVGFGEVPQKKHILFSEDKFNVGQVIDNNYAKTKYEAEELMRSAREKGYNINIFRMGNISCEMEGGKFQKNIEQNAFYILTRSFLRLGVIPQSDLKTVDLTYVDSAAKAIYLLSTRKELNNETYHIENTELLSFTHMGEMIKQNGENVTLESYDHMWDYFTKVYTESKDIAKTTEINNIVAYIDFLPWHTPTMFSFVKDKTKYILNRMGFEWKEPDQQIMDNLINYGKNVGFFD